MTTSVSSLMTRLDDDLQDATRVRWTAAERLRWLNDGQREIVMYKPNANSAIVNIPLVAGTKQTIPAGHIQLLYISRNMGTGATPGRVIRLVDRDIMDAQMPGWHSDTANATVRHYMVDDQTPANFYTYPPVPASPSVVVEGACSVSPTDCTANGNITLSDIYANALVDYVLYRCFRKDSEDAGNAQLAIAHYQAFERGIGIKSAGDKKADPRGPH